MAQSLGSRTCSYKASFIILSDVAKLAKLVGNSLGQLTVLIEYLTVLLEYITIPNFIGNVMLILYFIGNVMLILYFIGNARVGLPGPLLLMYCTLKSLLGEKFVCTLYCIENAIIIIRILFSFQVIQFAKQACSKTSSCSSFHYSLHYLNQPQYCNGNIILTTYNSKPPYGTLYNRVLTHCTIPYCYHSVHIGQGSLERSCAHFGYGQSISQS